MGIVAGFGEPRTMLKTACTWGACTSATLASAAASLSFLVHTNFISAFFALSATLAAIATAIFIDIAYEDDTNEDDATGDRAKEYSKVAQHVSAKQTHEDATGPSSEAMTCFLKSCDITRASAFSLAEKAAFVSAIFASSAAFFAVFTSADYTFSTAAVFAALAGVVALATVVLIDIASADEDRSQNVDGDTDGKKRVDVSFA